MTDNDIKYKAIFGDMAQFNGMMPDCEFVDGTYGYKRVGDKFYYCERHNEKYGWYVSQTVSINFRPIAMRRIIKEPKRWTVEDQKAGRLPEVGCNITNSATGDITVIFSKDDFIVTISPAGVIGKYSIREVFSFFAPIETPREKYDRERDECIDKLLAKIPPSPITVVPAMKIVYEELRPFTGGDHD